ncbi:MAG: hypothetical protein J6Y69_05575 [Treponema sp.]|nr:hypothetical protein [Treponema sp.]
MDPRKLLFAITITLTLFPLFARDRDEEYYSAIIQQQAAEIQKLDERNAAEEEKARQKRSQAENRRIDAETEEFYQNAAKMNINNTVDDEAVKSKIQFIEQLKETISLVQMEDQTGESTEFLKTELQNAYADLKDATYTTSSIDSSLIIRGSTYKLKKNAWTLTFYSTILDHIDLFNMDIDISFYQMTGKDYTPKTLENVEQIEFYNHAIELYDSMFRQAIPIFYAKLTYKILPWKKASEYRFIPQTLTIYHSDTNKILATYDKLDLSPEIFIVYPQIEIRTKEEKDADNSRANDILDVERAEEKRRTQTSTVSNNTDTSKKRNAVYASANTLFSNNDFTDFNIQNIGLETLSLTAVLGIGKYGHAGLIGGLDYNNGGEKSYTMGLTGGFNFTFAKCLRPVLQFQTYYQTDKRLCQSAGIGIDFIFGKGMFTLGYDFTAKYYISETQARGSFAPEDIKLLHSFKAGMGVTW